MSRRIAPRNERPAHEIEIGWLRDLTVSVKCGFYKLSTDDVIRRTITYEMLAEWVLVHRSNLVGCWGHKYRSRFTDDLHDDDVKFVDALVDKLKQGLTDGDATAAITQEDIDTLERTYRALAACKERLVYYR